MGGARSGRRGGDRGAWRETELSSGYWAAPSSSRETEVTEGDTEEDIARAARLWRKPGVSR